MNNFCNNDCLWLLLLLFCCGGNKCGSCVNIECILWIYLILCCCGGQNGGCGCKEGFGFGCK